MATQKSPAPHEEQEEEHNIVPDLPESVSQGKRREHRLLNALDAVDQGLLPDMVAEAYNFFFEAEIVDLRKAQSTTSPQPAFKIPDPEFFENSSIAISWEQWKDKMMNKIRAFGNSDPIVQLIIEEIFVTLEGIYRDPNKKQNVQRPITGRSDLQVEQRTQR
ncbi:predicted protein [Sclerotinia sclerotiorum 1980 UF-70]|uniref:Uncharacterized protein n=1 Tax=Sclerotinia sclerotiorum (strain ATCC 18683 / 1980 / Ss-1) TaxID=665079 RepID=A7EPJ2_SCLS1|nr:predicted protein [Sclerotinia sclerotiorum 1980 UF-70]EDO04758.1 predicted protein [Sclerotinia sclerotiorum 1980 UF-70]